MILQNDESVKTKNKIHNLSVYSGDRDITAFNSPNNYTIRFLDTVGETFKNIVSIKLVSAVLPNVNSLMTEPFLIMNIKEFSYGMSGTNSALKNSSSILQFEAPIIGRNFVDVKTDLNKSVFNDYERPIGEISKLTIEFKKITGALFNFGTDAAPNPNHAIQHLLEFEIVTREANTSGFI